MQQGLKGDGGGGLGGPSTLTSQTLWVSGCRGLGQRFYHSIPDSLGICTLVVSGFFLLTREGVGERESPELVGSRSVEGVGEEASG